MSVLNAINSSRRRIMGALTKNIGSSQTFSDSERKNIKTILLSRPNHRLGNLILITPIVQELEILFPNSKIDIFIKGNLGPIVLQEFHTIHQFLKLPKNHFKQLPFYIWTWLKIPFKKYDLVINIDPHSSSGKLSTKLSRGKYKIFGTEENLEKIQEKHMAKRPVEWIRQQFQIPKNECNPISSLDLRLTPSELSKGKNILHRLVQNEKPTISIFTFATGNKCYSKMWWMKFYFELKKKFPEHNIVEVLPKENVSQIDFSELTYYSHDLREICSFIANTSLFIGADSGMMHLATASKTPVVGLFSVTKPEIYRPYGSKNHVVNPEKTSISECLEIIESILNPVWAMEVSK